MTPPARTSRTTDPDRRDTRRALPFTVILLAATAILAVPGVAGEPQTPGAPDAANAPDNPGAALLSALAALEPGPVDEIWPAVDELKKAHQGKSDALRTLSEKVHELGGKAKLAGAAILFSRNEAPFQQRGQVALQQLARDGAEKAVRVAAIRLLKNPARFDEAYLTLKDVAGAADDPEIKIEATLALWGLDNHHSVRLPLVKLLQDKSTALRQAAALALAETGYLQPPVDEIVRVLAKEPSNAGKHARLLLRMLDRKPEGGERKTTPGDAAPPAAPTTPPTAATAALAAQDGQAWPSIAAEVEQAILKHSLYRDTIDRRDLYIAAIRGMVSSLDEYSAFQDPDEVRQVEASRLGTYWGLGADIVKPGKDAPLVVAKPYQGGPAFLAGLRSGDRILEVNGVTTHDRDRAELERLTAGERDGEVHLLVSRWGWAQPRMMAVQRGSVEVPSLGSRLLPGKVGYIKVSRFGPAAAEEFEKALDLLEAAGLEALVVDLRDNPGGNLKQAVRIVDLFVGESSQPIVTERAPFRVTEWSASADEKPRHPMAVIVNRWSASAAEVVAGALQDFQRACLIGQTTFGKGVKQVSVPLSQAAAALLDGESRLLLTAGRLYLPLGRAIQTERGKNGQPLAGRQGGIEPDIKVEGGDEGYQGRQTAELLKVEYSPQVGEYVHKNYTAMKHLFEEGDVWDPGNYPGFDELYFSLGTKLTRNDVRHAIRALIRRHLEDERGEEILADFRADAALERAILELYGRLGRDPDQVPEYKGLAARRVLDEFQRKE